MVFTHKLTGIIEIRNGIRINISGDICAYYRKLFIYHTYRTKRCQSPLYGNHISIVLPDIHGFQDFTKVKEFHRQETVAWYNPEDLVVSPKNVWLKVHLPIGDRIKEKLKIKEKNFFGYHLVCANFKFH